MIAWNGNLDAGDKFNAYAVIRNDDNITLKILMIKSSMTLCVILDIHVNYYSTVKTPKILSEEKNGQLLFLQSASTLARFLKMIFLFLFFYLTPLNIIDIAKVQRFSFYSYLLTFFFMHNSMI